MSISYKCLLLSILLFVQMLVLHTPATAQGQEFYSPINSVYQYSTPVGESLAYLWIPPGCKRVRGIIMSLSNLLERRWLEDPIIRKAAAEDGLAIIWVGGGKSTINADMNDVATEALQRMLDSMAAESGYEELKTAPFIPMGHSADGHFAWTFANAFPERTIAAIPIKTVPLPASSAFKNIPVCYLVGQTTEWPQYRVPDPAIKPGDRDFFWPVVRQSAVSLRTADENNLVAVVTEPGGGHFDWSERQARFVALFIMKACKYRLPENMPATGSVKLRDITPEMGWLTDTGGMEPDTFKPAPYQKYKGDRKKAYWFFDKETALAAVAFNGDRKQRKRQMLTFVQNGQLLNVAKLGYAPLKFIPGADGLTFHLKAGFLTEMPQELIAARTLLGHAPGPVKFNVITGPAVQINDTTFQVRFDRQRSSGEIWIEEEHDGNWEYRRTVQPGQIKIPVKLTEGKSQAIRFPKIEDQQADTKSVQLNAISSSGLPVGYYVVSGPAYIDGNTLRLTEIPIRSKYPVKITVVAYQWGRTVPPLYQSAEPITQDFFITKP